MGHQHGTRRFLIFFTSIMLVLSLFLAACGDDQKDKESKSADKKITIGYQKNGPLIILKSLGYLEKRLEPLNVEVEWAEFQAGPALLEALNAGSIDFGRTGDSPPVFAQAAGTSLVYVAAGNPKFLGSAILVKPNSSIKSIQDLKGKTVGFAKGSSSHFLVTKALEKAGLTFKDIKPAYLAPGDARVAFEQGKIDAWAIWDPFTADAEKATGAKMLVNGEGLTSDRDFFLASKSYAEKNEDILKIIVEEIQRSSDWANNNQKEAASMLSKILGIDEGALLMSIKRREYGVGEVTPDIIQEQQNIADTYFKLKIIPKKIKVKEKVYNIVGTGEEEES